MNSKTIKVMGLPQEQLEEIYNYLYATQPMAQVEKLVNYLRNAKEYQVAFIEEKK